MYKTNSDKNILMFLIIIALFVMFSVNVYSGNIAVCTDMNIEDEVYTLTADIDNAAATCMEITADGVTLDCDGFYIDGQDSGNGIEIDNYFENITIINCEVQQFFRDLESDYNVNVTIENFTSFDAAYYGMDIDHPTNFTFRNVTINYSMYTGISFAYHQFHSVTNIYNLTIINGQSSGSTYSGFYYIQGATDSLLNISGFNISDNTNYGFYVQQHGPTIDLNDGHIDNNGNNGLYSASTGPIFYLDNITFFNNYKDGIHLGYSTGGVIKNCNISYNGQYGLYFYYSVIGYNVTGNDIKYNYERDVTVSHASSTGNTFWNNNFEVNLMTEDKGSNDWNLTNGNTWDNYDSDDEDCVGVGGFCPNPYLIAGTSGMYDKKALYTGVQGTLQQFDCHNCVDCTEYIANWTVQFGDNLSLDADINDYGATCIDFQGHNGILFDGGDFTLDGTGTGYAFDVDLIPGGLTVGSDWITIRNVHTQQFARGIYDYYSYNLTVYNFTADAHVAQNIYLYYPDVANFTNIFLNNSGDSALVRNNYANSKIIFKNITSIGSSIGFSYDTPSKTNSFLNITSFNFSKNSDGFEMSGSGGGTVYLKDGHIDNNADDGLFTQAGQDTPVTYVDNVTFINNTGHGVDFIGDSSGGEFKNCTIMFNKEYGLHLQYDIDNYNFTNNTIKYNYDRDVYIVASSQLFDNRFWKNHFEVSALTVDLDGDNHWNLTISGNQWDNYDSDDEDCISVAGFCANDYQIGGGTESYDKKAIYTGIQGTLNDYNCSICGDCTERIHNWSIQFGDNLTLRADINNFGDHCIDFRGHNGILFNGSNHLMDGTGVSNAFSVCSIDGSCAAGTTSSDFITIRDIRTQQFHYGIRTFLNFNLTVINFTSFDQTIDGLFLNYQDTGYFENIFINKSGSEGIRFDYHQTGSNTQFYNLTITGTSGAGSEGFYYYTPSSNSILNITLFNISRNNDIGFYQRAGGSDRYMYLTDGYIENNVDDGLYMITLTNSVFFIENVSISSNGDYGLYMYGTTGGYINNSIIWNNSDYGLYFNSLVDTYNVSNTKIMNNTNLDVYIAHSSCDDNRFWNNVFGNNNTNVSDVGTSTHWNISTRGNQWENFDTNDEGCFDNNYDGICDNANVSIDPDSYDMLPLYGGPEIYVNSCQDLDTENGYYVLTADIDNAPGTCLRINNHGITLNCNGKYVDGQNVGNGIEILANWENISVLNSDLRQFAYNFKVTSVKNLTVENFTSQKGLSYGIYMDTTDNVTLTNIFVNRTGSRGVEFRNNAANSIIIAYNFTVINTNSPTEPAFYYQNPSATGSVLNMTNFNISYNKDRGFVSSGGGSAARIFLKDGYIINNTDDGINAGWQIPLYLDNVTVSNNNDYGIYLASNIGGEIKNSHIINNSDSGVYLFSAVDNYNFSNNNITNNTGFDVRINNADCDDNLFWNNTFDDNNTNVSDSGTGTEWNISTGGNRWLNFDEPSEGCFDIDGDGFCDNANVTIDPDPPGNKDELPLYNGPVFGCGFNMTTDVTLSAALDCNGTALNLVADNIKLDCANYIIRGDGAGEIGLKVNSTNVTIAGCNIYNFTTNVYADPGFGLKVQNNTFENSSNCTILEAYNISIISNNSYHNCTDNAILLVNDSGHNKIYNNTINLSWIGVNIRNGSNNTVWNNSFTNSLHLHANSITGNNFNRTQGNYWDDILSLKIFDSDADGLGDIGSEYPYNNTNNANVTGLVNDYRPFTTKSPGKFVVNITAPINNSISNTSNVNITCEVNSTDDVNNLTFIIWNVAGVVEQTNSTNPALPNVTLTWEATLSDGNYTAGCNATNVLSQINVSDNRTFRVDSTRPLVQLISPADGTSTTTTNNSFVFEVNDSTLMNCSLLIDRNHVANFTDLQNGTYTSDEFLAVGIYTWNVTCVDEAGWTNTSDTWTITITSAAAPAGGPVQGGGNQYIVIDDETLLEQKKIKAEFEVPKILDLIREEVEELEQVEEEVIEEKPRVIKEIPKKTTKFSLKAFFLALFLLTLIAIFVFKKRTDKTDRKIEKFKKSFNLK